ncbi:MAG: DNA adenine methylase [Candidatus Krumholzibacteriota bacterium]|nr:DNA adenine methylase [Candidatus Krumholzibacteriota bacterium]
MTTGLITKNQPKRAARPFLKWVGGKNLLINELISRFPQNIKDTGKIKRYVEPFVGGGALFFYLMNNFKIEKSFLFDINRELIVGFKVIKNNPSELINELKIIENRYVRREVVNRKKMYYQIREKYNKQMLKFNFTDYTDNWVERAAYLIFLNKTCYNGLFRQNSKGKFNVPSGRYKNPTICDEVNILEVSKVLKNTKIVCGDFERAKRHITKNSMVYFDPPYRPISSTSNFTGYFKDDFNNEDQIRLAEYFKKMNKKGAYLLLSNSDPKNYNVDDDYFDDLYSGFNIERVTAKRVINCNAEKRGEVKELIIRNYDA